MSASPRPARTCLPDAVVYSVRRSDRPTQGPPTRHAADQAVTEWQTAVGCLIGAAEGRDFLMHARVGMLRALNRNVERTFNPDRKDTHWGKRKLKRDQ
jgi:hypothetical protein